MEEFSHSFPLFVTVSHFSPLIPIVFNNFPLFAICILAVQLCGRMEELWEENCQRRAGNTGIELSIPCRVQTTVKLAGQYGAVQTSAVQFITVHYNTVQCSALQYSAV